MNIQWDVSEMERALCLAEVMRARGLETFEIELSGNEDNSDIASAKHEKAARALGWLPGPKGSTTTHWRRVRDHGVGYTDTTWKTLCEREGIK